MRKELVSCVVCVWELNLYASNTIILVIFFFNDYVILGILLFSMSLSLKK